MPDVASLVAKKIVGWVVLVHPSGSIVTSNASGGVYRRTGLRDLPGPSKSAILAERRTQ